VFPLLDHVQQRCPSQQNRVCCCFNYPVARRVIQQSVILSHERCEEKRQSSSHKSERTECALCSPRRDAGHAPLVRNDVPEPPPSRTESATVPNLPCPRGRARRPLRAPYQRVIQTRRCARFYQSALRRVSLRSSLADSLPFRGREYGYRPELVCRGNQFISLSCIGGFVRAGFLFQLFCVLGARWGSITRISPVKDTLR